MDRKRLTTNDVDDGALASPPRPATTADTARTAAVSRTAFDTEPPIDREIRRLKALLGVEGMREVFANEHGTLIRRGASLINNDPPTSATQNTSPTRPEIAQSSAVYPGRLVPPKDALAVFGYHNRMEPFDLVEQLIFAVAFSKSPKEFEEIAMLLPGRTGKDCIDHYYEKKWDGRFKTESKLAKMAERRERFGSKYEQMQFDYDKYDYLLGQHGATQEAPSAQTQPQRSALGARDEDAASRSPSREDGEVTYRGGDASAMVANADQDKTGTQPSAFQLMNAKLEKDLAPYKQQLAEKRASGSEQ